VGLNFKGFQFSFGGVLQQVYMHQMAKSCFIFS